MDERDTTEDAVANLEGEDDSSRQLTFVEESEELACLVTKISDASLLAVPDDYERLRSIVRHFQ